MEEIRTGQKTLSFDTMYNQKTPSGASLGRNPEALRLSQNEMPTPNSVNNNIRPIDNSVNVGHPITPQDPPVTPQPLSTTPKPLSNEAKGNEIVNLAKSEFTPYKKQAVDIFGAQPKTIETAQKSLNIDVNGYTHQVDNYGLRHALSKHSTDEIPLTMEDIRRIPDILSNPDDVIPAGLNRQGKETILLLQKTIHSQTVHHWTRSERIKRKLESK